MAKATKLTELTIKETSGVDHPAHLHEGWMVMKSEDDLDTALNQIIEPDSQENTVELNATPEVEEATEEATEVAPAEQVEATPVAASVDGPDETEVQKELTDLRKELELAKEAHRELIEERELEKAATAAHQWAILPGLNPVDFAKVLVRLRAADQEVAKEVEAILSASSVALSEAGVFTELGAEGDEDGAMDAFGRIEKAAQALVDSGEATSVAKGIALITERNPELYNDYLNEKRG
jgi:uncharacterized membrane protein|tara:strand:+ start:1932 stop:2645 length:714 start_codon:yes stop_codon:yes gene_type:complete